MNSVNPHKTSATMARIVAAYLRAINWFFADLSTAI
jgi:hypothetical protein